MEGKTVTEKSIITEIKQKFRLLNTIATFIVIILLAVMLSYLYEPATQAMDFLQSGLTRLGCKWQ